MPMPTLEPVDAPRPADEDRYRRVLEEGRILFFPRTPFSLPDEDRALLLRQRQSGAGYHKNIAYRPAQDRVTGSARGASGFRFVKTRRMRSPRVGRLGKA